MVQLKNINSHFFRQEDISPLAIFRIVFGLLIFLESVGAIFTGWIKKTLIDPDFTFTFIGLEWLQPLPGSGMHIYYFVMGLFGLMVMFGFYYRIGITCFGLMWTATYLMQKSSYNNHYYLLILLCLLMAILPAHRYYSMDVKAGRCTEQGSMPAWCRWAIILQLAIVYIYAGISKMNPDWIAAMPIKLWFSTKANYPIIGNILQESMLQQIVAYGGIFYDTFIVFILLWKRTRWFGVIISVCFHLFNSVVFGIGIFPYLMLGFLLFFFEPDKIRSTFFKKKNAVLATGSIDQSSLEYSHFLKPLLVVYFILQIALPLRHYFYQGNPHWTEEGHRMAWHMMLRAKGANIKFDVVDRKTGKSELVNPNQFLTDKQARKMAGKPDMIWQFCQFLKKKYSEKGIDEIEIYAQSWASLNGRPPKQYINPEINLAEVKWERFSHADWILPMKED